MFYSSGSQKHSCKKKFHSLLPTFFNLPEKKEYSLTNSIDTITKNSYISLRLKQKSTYKINNSEF